MGDVACVGGDGGDGGGGGVGRNGEFLLLPASAHCQ